MVNMITSKNNGVHLEICSYRFHTDFRRQQNKNVSVRWDVHDGRDLISYKFLTRAQFLYDINTLKKFAKKT